MLLFGSAFGVLADRVRRINILIGIHAVDLFVALTLAILFMLGMESIWIIYPMVALIGCGWAADFSARRSLIDEIQERSLLANSMSLEALSMSGSKIVATTTAGLLLTIGEVGAGLLVSGRSLRASASSGCSISGRRLPFSERTASRDNPVDHVDAKRLDSDVAHAGRARGLHRHGHHQCVGVPLPTAYRNHRQRHLVGRPFLDGFAGQR